MVADIVVSKYAWHLPLYRQAQMMAAEGITIDRSTLAHWVGFAAFELMPVYDRLVASLKSSNKLFADETRCPVLDPGRGKTKTGYLWALARDDRPWGGTDPPAVAHTYAPGRGVEHALRNLVGFSGTLQVDGYVAYKQLTDACALYLVSPLNEAPDHPTDDKIERQRQTEHEQDQTRGDAQTVARSPAWQTGEAGHYIA